MLDLSPRTFDHVPEPDRRKGVVFRDQHGRCRRRWLPSYQAEATCTCGEPIVAKDRTADWGHAEEVAS